MGTKDLVVFAFMVIGAVLVGLAGLGIADHYHDAQFFPLGVCVYMIGRIVDRFWNPAT